MICPTCKSEYARAILECPEWNMPLMDKLSEKKGKNRHI